MSYTYSQYVTYLANMIVVPASDPNYQTVLPNIIDDAEQRLYRELDLLNTVFRDATGTLSTGTQDFNLPTAAATFVVLNTLNVITPVGPVTTSSVRNPLTPTTLDVIYSLWPGQAGSTVPQYFAMLTQETVIVAPAPDQAYTVEAVGTYRPIPLSPTNVVTLLTQYFPDLFMAASLVFASGYMKNFGAMQGDPQSGVSWEQHYQTLMQSAQTEEQRKKFNMAGWSSKQPAPSATPPRA